MLCATINQDEAKSALQKQNALKAKGPHVENFEFLV